MNIKVMIWLSVVIIRFVLKCDYGVLYLNQFNSVDNTKLSQQ